MNFPSINIQGNILNSEIIDKIVNEDLKHQDPISFGLRKTDRLREEIGLAWSAIRGLWQTFSMRRNRIGDEESGTSETRNFWMLPFFATLGYDVEKANAEMMDHKSYAISHRATNLQGFPVHIMGINDSLDKRREASGPRLSPHALVQEYLNKSEDYLYALVTNGKHLRLLRDSSRLVRLTYIEFDLEKMMDEEIYADFAILYRLLHATRMPKVKGEGENSIFEFYHQEALSSGTRIREKLSEAVEYAIKELANGFLKHPANEALRINVQAGIITPAEFYLQSLRLVYRILFLLVIEDRGLVYPDKLDEATRRKREIYWKFYSMDRLRRLAAQQQFVEANKYDLWENLKVVFLLFEDARYAQKLGLQPLASGIFHPDALGQLEHTLLTNQHLLEVVQKLCYFSDKTRATMVRVNYGDLDVEEFGSVYEGLLEYQPVFAEVDNQWVFTFEKGSERSSSGSHYTPEELVRPLIKHSLDYLIEDCLNKPEERIKTIGLPQRAMQEQALLSLRVCDVACGSGHILLSAARRIATELAKVRTAEEQPSPPALRHAMRDTIRHTIYGVDKNPLAVELCKVALWLEAHNPGEPLNFLDHHIKCGDSIVGLAHRSELENGIADEAFKTLPGDEADIAAAFRKQNKDERKEREGKATQLKTNDDDTSLNLVQEAMAEYLSFARMPETTPEQIAKKQKAYQQFLDGRGHQWLKQMADMQVAQFFIPKTTANKPYLLTDAAYRQMLAGYKGWQGQHAAKANVLAQEKRFFHWFIEFPEVFSSTSEGGGREGAAGFDCILGNPPFLGGSKLSGTFGYPFLEYLRCSYTYSGGLCDLVGYFFRRIFIVLSDNSYTALISTNTISQGDTKEASLDYILSNGGVINFAVKSQKWPGNAAVEVALVSLFKKGISNKSNIEYFLNGKKVVKINSYLNDNEFSLVNYTLKKNEGISYNGSSILGKGFFLDKVEYDELVNSDNKYIEILYPVINGDELNNNYLIQFDRFVINFFDWTIEKCQKYSEAFSLVKERVLPERLKQNDKGAKEKWWQYLRPRTELYLKLKDKNKCLAVALTSKTLAFVFLPTNIVYTHAIGLFVNDTFSFFAVLQSNLHSIWAWQFGSTMKSDLRYTSSDIFENFPFPQNYHKAINLEKIGESYHEHRRVLMLSMQLGSTKTYNAFHAPEVQPGITTAMLEGKDKKTIEKQYGKEVWYLWNHLQKTPGTCTIEEAIAGIQKLRELHVEMDNAVLEAYGWNNDELKITNYEDNSEALIHNSKLTFESSVIRNSKFVIDLKHNFYEVDYLPENDRIRFTIHPDARKEVLKRLLQLNHQIFEQEAREGKHKEETVRKFYEQKGEPVPEEVSKWFNKGKTYKTKKANTSKANEPEGGYGDLFNI
jgi:hypothetical protein